jgi:peptidyl-prolyl cis-trans isomerase SurA
MLAAALALAALATASVPRRLAAEPPARVIIDRVVAVVDDDVITLGELRRRARPFLERLRATKSATATVESALLKDMLDRLVDERIIAKVADREHITVSQDEVDRAWVTVRDAQKLTDEGLAKSVHEAGLSDEEYRDELRRQLFEGKVLARKIAPYIANVSKLSPEEQASKLEAGRAAFLAEEKKTTYVELRL